MYDDYYYSYDYSYDPSYAAGPAAGFVMFMYFIAIVIGIISLVSLWRLYKMAGHPGWASIIPIYNYYVLCDIVYGNGLYFLVYFIPLAGQLFAFYTMFKLARVYNKSDLFAVGLIFFSPIFLPLMAFNSNTYYSGPSTAYIDTNPPGFGSAGGYGNGYAANPMNTSGYDIYQGNQGFQNGGYKPQSNFQPQGGFQSQNSGFQPQGGFQSQNSGFQPQGGFQSQNSGFQPQGGFQSQNNDFQAQGGGSFDPHNANSYVDKNPYDSF